MGVQDASEDASLAGRHWFRLLDSFVACHRPHGEAAVVGVHVVGTGVWVQIASDLPGDAFVLKLTSSSSIDSAIKALVAYRPIDRAPYPRVIEAQNL